MKILVVEDDELNAYALSAVLTDQNYAVEVAHDGDTAWDLVATYDYDLILLDVMLPKLDGISLCRQIRSSGRQVPILLLTGCDSSHEKATGLDAGADDYVVKPFDQEELVARVRALLRRGGVTSQPILEWGNLKLDPSTCEATYNNNLISLTPKEYGLLELFMRNHRRVFSCGMILEHLWSYEDTPGEEAVRTHIKGLRMKLRTVGASSDLIETVYGIGYRLKSQEEEEEKVVNSQTLTAIADIWQRFRGRVDKQVQIIEQAVQNPELKQQAYQEAHTLAGSLGTFGLNLGSELAKKIEKILKSSKALTTKETSKLQNLVELLRQEIEGKNQETTPSITTDSRPLVLVIANDDVLAKQLKSQSDNFGLNLVITTNINAAKNQLDQQVPQVIFIDPSLNYHLKESETFLVEIQKCYPPIPIVIFSENIDFYNQLQLNKSGKYTFLQKPKSVNQVLANIKELVDNTAYAEAKILVVDDDSQILELLQTLLTPWGMKIIPLNDSRQFWTTWKSEKPDMLILDVEMPDINGIELCQMIRNNHQEIELPILFLTVHNDAEIVNQVFSAGADDFVSKPIIGAELVTRIINRLERVKLRQKINQNYHQQLAKQEKQTQSIKETYHQLLEVYPEAIFIESEGEFVFLNSAAVQLFGLIKDEDLIGKPILDFIHPHSQAGFREKLQKITTNKQSIPLHEVQFLKENGNVIYVEIVIAALIYQGKPATQIVARNITRRKQTELALQKANNELELRVAERTGELVRVNHQLQTELDERKQTQEALRISQTRFEGILSIADDAIISIDSSQGITLFNQGAEKMFGYSAEEVLGKPLDILLPMRFADAHRRHVNDFGQAPSLARRMGERQEIFGCKKDGTEFPAEASISKLDIGDECIYTVILRDITERRQIERMKDEFVSVVSHELRTPLTSIHGSLGMLTSGLLPTDSEQGKRLLQIATDSTERLVRLINDILDIERIESGKVKMEKEICYLEDLINSALNVMQSLADKANVNLAISSVPVQLWADPDRIVQTLTNLLSNAIKFSPPGSTVWLIATKQNNEVLLTVKDTGRGIPDNKLNSIFERFQQVDSSDSRNHDGTGLGLAICKSIVLQHDGSIWVESVVGKGSSFYFTLPILADIQSRELANLDDYESEIIIENNPLVLVCDDDAVIRNELAQLLKKGGYRVVTVATGEEAIASATNEHPDIILLDLMMPGMNGWETMAFLKKRKDTQDIPIVICSVYQPNDHHPSHPDFVDWLSKPVQEKSLLSSLQKIVSESSRKVRILIVEDDHDLAELLVTVFARHDIETLVAKTGREAIHFSQRVNPDLIILDLILPESDGFTVVDWLKQHNQLYNIPVVVYSAKDLDESERHRLKLGHTEFLTKGRVTTNEFEQRVMDLLQRITHRNS
ncbi:MULTISPECIES: response regulator [unclassified Anabaena]|uniref:response regulator n=1 Tax=unclassified Anabaena TaxID=2619674 RepID=UPI001448295C|nr:MULTISPECIES: response regulator [unclassified Anabaena]MTJ08117.1 response regulator [Anabaena sp. UHCC 0204]MTJ53157.1 response regulator [Anabaena sp. UHCC 0253]